MYHFARDEAGAISGSQPCFRKCGIGAVVECRRTLSCRQFACEGEACFLGGFGRLDSLYRKLLNRGMVRERKHCGLARIGGDAHPKQTGNTLGWNLGLCQ